MSVLLWWGGHLARIVSLLACYYLLVFFMLFEISFISKFLFLDDGWKQANVWGKSSGAGMVVGHISFMRNFRGFVFFFCFLWLRRENVVDWWLRLCFTGCVFVCVHLNLFAFLRVCVCVSACIFYDPCYISLHLLFASVYPHAPLVSLVIICCRNLFFWWEGE